MKTILLVLFIIQIGSFAFSGVTTYSTASYKYNVKIIGSEIGSLLPFNTVFEFNNYLSSLEDAVAGGLQVVDPELIGDILIYPNPCQQDRAELGYKLSGAMNLQIRIYSIYGKEVKRINIVQNDIGAKLGYNKLPIVLTDSFNNNFGNGIYLVFLIDKEKNTVLAKTKLAVAK